MSFRNYCDTSSYGRSRSDRRSHASTDLPTSVTAKYITTPSYKTSSIPILSRDRSATREKETPIATIANRYANYNKTSKDDKPSTKYSEKKEPYKLSIPTVTSNRSRDVSPVSTTSKYSLNRSSRHLSPDRRATKTSSLIKGRSRDPSPTDRDKDIPNKTDKTSGYNSLSSYKLYPRTSTYTRPASRTDVKPEITVNRYAIANRLATNYLRTPISDKSRTSVSPVNHIDLPKLDIDKKSLVTNSIDIKQSEDRKSDDKQKGNGMKNELSDSSEVTSDNRLQNGTDKSNVEETKTVTVITRHTSPTPPGSSVYVRTRRADMAKVLEKTISRSNKRPEMVNKEIQSDRLDDPTRCSRFGSTSRANVSNWSIYTPSSSSYTGYAGRYSTHYGNAKEGTTMNSNSDKSASISPHREVISKDNYNSSSPTENKDSNYMSENNVIVENNPEIITTVSENQNDDNSEIIINVNLKLKKANNPLVVTSAELVSPEVTITNNQLPPQAPKPEGTPRTKKVKVRKSSTDSSSDSSKKKIVKKRSKSISSTDSDQSNESNDKSGSVSLSKINVSSNEVNKSKSKHSNKSRESDSPESSITLSTQSSLSEDDTISKSKTNDLSKTSADDISIPMDRSNKQSSPQRNDSGAEEAKSFLIRALAPVTSLFKMRQQDSSENSKWLESSTSESTGKDVSNLTTESDRSNKSKNNTNNIIANDDDDMVKLKMIKPIESGERPWWMDSELENTVSKQSSENQKSPSDNNLAKKMDSGERAWWLESNSECKNENQTTLSNDISDTNKQPKKCNFVSLDKEDKPWWLDSSANIPEGIERLTPPRKLSTDSDKSEKFDFYKVRHIESGEKKDWWLTSSENTSTNKSQSESHSNNLSKSSSDQRRFPLRRIRHIESGERPWWLSSSKNIPEGIEKLPTPPPQSDSDSSDSDEVVVYLPSKQQIPPFPLNLPDDEPLGDRKSPEGLETPRTSDDYNGRISPYENARQYRKNRNTNYQNKGVENYISRYTDIDDILGTSGQIYSPFMDSILARRTGQMAFDEECEEIDPTQVRIHDSTAQRPVIKKLGYRNESADYHDESQLDDAALQVFKDGDYGPYLDMDSTLCEQEEELDGLQDSRKNAIVLRTQLSVRVHGIIERLLHSQGRELRRALFTLKQVLQSDKDLVHEFVANKGLDCLMQVSNMADHNYLDYILRALGQILLYIDGMHGVMAHKRCVQWLYSLIASKFRHVVKTALKLLLVFVEYTEKNCLLLIDAIQVVDNTSGRESWHNIMKILQDIDASDTELLIYATTLINRCLNNVPDRDTYYDQVDALQEQGMDDIIQLYMSKQGTDLDLLRQLQIFEAVLIYEDGDETGTALKQLDESIVNSIRRRSINIKTSEKRKSKKQQLKEKEKTSGVLVHPESETKNPINSYITQYLTPINKNKENRELSVALRRRRERFSRQAHHIIQQRELFTNSNGLCNSIFGNTNGVNNGVTNGSGINNTTNGNNRAAYQDEDTTYIDRTMKNLNIADVLVNGNQRYTSGLKQRIHNGTLGHSVNPMDSVAVIRQKQMENGATDIKDDRGILLHREHSIKDLAQRLTSPVSPTTEDKLSRVADMAGIVSKAKEELAKSQSKEVIKSPTIEIAPKVHEIKISENDLHWEELKKGCLNREFHLCDLNFSDLKHDSDDDVPSPAISSAGVPPPPPPGMFPLVGAPPPPPGSFFMNRNNVPAPPAKPSLSAKLSSDSDSSTIKKNKKTVKLFWKEIQENPMPTPLHRKIGGFIWDDLPDVNLDTKMLEHLFESRTNDLIIKEKLTEPKRNLILDAKRSNAINIAMKKLPTPQTIKAAIMKMDATVIGREGIDKLMIMLPTEEEKVKIHEAQYANPDLPLGSAEQFLLTLASISELSSRLKLWVFKLDFDNLEKEIAEPLMDLKQGIELLKVNKTFKAILSTLRTVGSFLNGSQVKGFRLEYLSKVMEVKDTVHKHPLLYHICEMIIEKFPDSTDFFSEVGPVIRASKVDFDILTLNLNRLEADCKASWDHMKRIAKHDSTQISKTKINEFLTDAAERIILLSIIKKRVMGRYHKFLLYLGVPPPDLDKTKPSEFLKVIAEFALEYRTSRERVLQQLEKRANHRERNKTRGKMIIDVGNYSTKNGENSADTALKELLKNNADTDSLINGRQKSIRYRMPINGDITADDEIFESLVKSTTSKRRPVTRDRKRAQLSDSIYNRTLHG